MEYQNKATDKLEIVGDDSAIANGKETIEISVYYSQVETTRNLSVAITLMVLDIEATGQIPIFSNGASTINVLTDTDGYASVKLTSKYPGTFKISGFVQSTMTQGVGEVTFQEEVVSKNTYFPEGTHVFAPDTAYNDIAAKTALTDKSSHYVGTYITQITNSTSITDQDIHLQIITSKGITLPEVQVAQNHSNYQKDPTVVPIPGTDDFIVIWSSNAQDKDTFVICARKFRVANDTLIALTNEMVISSAAQSHVGPCAIFNTETDSMLVSWFAVKDEKVHLQYFNENIEAVGQEQTLGYSVSSKYFVSGLDMALENFQTTDANPVSMINVGAYVYATYKLSSDTIGVYALTAGSLGSITQTLITERNISSFGFFDTVYDAAHEQMIITYNNPSQNNYLYALAVQVYANGKAARADSTEPVRINKISNVCIAPSITELTSKDENGNAIFVVTWLQTGQGIRYSYINSQLNLVGTERSINEGDNSTEYRPYVVSTFNQVLIHLTANKHGSISFAKSGTIYHVENYS